LGTAVAAGAAAATLLGPGPLKEKVRALAEGYALSRGVEFAAVRVLGPRFAARYLGGTLGAVAGFALDLCDGLECERREQEARAKSEKALEVDILVHAAVMYEVERRKGNQPEWNIVLDMAIHEKYVELGLDKRRSMNMKALDLTTPEPTRYRGITNARPPSMSAR
jgi:hypothetical protein